MSNKDNALPSNARKRKAIHAKNAAAVKAAKKIRGVRAEIHEAMEVAAAMRRSKKRGTADTEANMESLGFARVSPNTRPNKDATPYGVEDKYTKVTKVVA